jgi:hypothetical protein
MDQLPTDKQEIQGDQPEADLSKKATESEPERLSDGNYVGDDNIREGHVGGLIGGPHQQGGEGQGG